MEDNRRSKRITFREPVQFRIPGQPGPEGCLAKDLSETGIRLNSARFIPIKEKMTLTLQADTDLPIDVQGEVVWVQRVPHSEYYQLGLVFNLPANSSFKELQKYIHSH